MNKLPLAKKAIMEAAKQHAIGVLGQDEFIKNKEAARSLMEDFTSAAEWTMKAMLQLSDSPGDPAHRLITTERLTHLVRGYDANHDAQYQNNELVVTGILMAATGTPLEQLLSVIPWPIKGYPDKRGKLDAVRERVIGASLIAGQIDLDIKKSVPAESEVASV